jgi:hypothetical protein
MRDFEGQSANMMKKSQWLASLACFFAFAAIGAPQSPTATAFGSVLKLEESVSKVLYFHESGGLITATVKPPEGSGREPMPPLPAPGAKVRPPRPASTSTSNVAR